VLNSTRVATVPAVAVAEIIRERVSGIVPYVLSWSRLPHLLQLVFPALLVRTWRASSLLDLLGVVVLMLGHGHPLIARIDEAGDDGLTGRWRDPGRGGRFSCSAVKALTAFLT
jgi:hypothetical protein